MGGWATLQVFADDNAVAQDEEQESQVIRAWSNHRSGPIDGLLAALDASAADIVHVQYNFGFFTLPELGRLIDHESPRRPIVVTMHRTAPLQLVDRIDSIDEIARQLMRCDAVIVHQVADQQRLAEIGAIENVHLLQHGTEALVATDMTGSRRRHRIPPRAFVVGTFGFLLPHKGVLALLRAVAELQGRGIDAWLVATTALHPDPSSAAHLAEVVTEIERLGIADAVRLVTDYLHPDDARDRLAAADVLVMPYEHTNESASGALRSVLPLGRAMVTSDLPIFDDVAGLVPSLPAPVDPRALADLLENLWVDSVQREQIAAGVRQLAESTSWARTAAWTRELYTDLLSEREAAARRATVS
jgi:glycosyltransferase involved in cell wall biosynthesis